LALDAGLLITDAKIAATCKAMGVGQIATNDRDFERVNLKVWAMLTCFSAMRYCDRGSED
jgi:predicted nucleic acid-binding protein